MKLRQNYTEEKAGKLSLQEPPYFNFRGNLALSHGKVLNVESHCFVHSASFCLLTFSLRSLSMVQLINYWLLPLMTSGTFLCI